MLAYSDNLPWVTEKAPLCRTHLAMCVANLLFSYQWNRYFFQEKHDFVWWKICMLEFINDKARRGCLGSYSCRLQPLPSLSPSPLTVVADASNTSAKVHFNCNSSGISKCCVCVLSVKLCICGKQSAFGGCCCTSPPPLASTDFPLKVEERGRKRNFEINPTIRWLYVKILPSTFKDILVLSCGHETFLK